MSRNYNTSKAVPTDVLAERLAELATAVTKGRDSVAREFCMRIPAEVDRDADLVMSEASARLQLSTLRTDEQDVIDKLVAAWNAYVKLDVMHPDEQIEFRHNLHACQHIILARVGVRAMNQNTENE